MNHIYIKPPFDQIKPNALSLKHTHTTTTTTTKGLNLRRWRQGLENFERERLMEMGAEGGGSGSPPSQQRR